MDIDAVRSARGARSPPVAAQDASRNVAETTARQRMTDSPVELREPMDEGARGVERPVLKALDGVIRLA
jgi:hypothetical protein